MGSWTDYGIGNDAQKGGVSDPDSIETLDPNPDWGSGSRGPRINILQLLTKKFEFLSEIFGHIKPGSGFGSGVPKMPGSVANQ